MQADILLVTVTTVETQAVLNIFNRSSGTSPTRLEIDGKIYRDLGIINGKRIFLVRSEMGGGSPGGAYQSVHKGIASLRPTAVIMVGIAFGFDHAKQAIGDVLVSKQLLLYDFQRVGTNSQGDIKIICRGDRVSASTRLLDRLRSVDEEFGRSFKVRYGLILSGEKLIDNINFRDQLLQLAPEAIGGEMEGGGIYAACLDNKTDWILVKGICDWADGKKNDNRNVWQKKAARNAAKLIFQALTQTTFRTEIRDASLPPLTRSAAASAEPQNSTYGDYVTSTTRDQRHPDESKPKIVSPVKNAPYYPPLVISAHGIRTRGEWQKVLGSVLSGSPTKVEAFDYGKYGLGKFLFPFGIFNERMISRFYKWYGEIISSCPQVDLESYEKRPSIVAHSFGSWIVANAMLRHAEVKVDKLILAGSILPCDFDWMTLFARDQVAFVRNECGQKDPWPGWADRLIAGGGTGGSAGFEWFGKGVDNVVQEWFGHSDALMRQHIERNWVPVLRERPSPLALLHGRNIHELDRFTKILNHTGNVIDTEAFATLPHYEEVEIPRGLSQQWIKVNPDIYTFLIDRSTQTPAGYINAMPIEDCLYQEIREGKTVDNEVSDTGIVPFVNGGSLKIYFMSIAISENYRRWGDGILQQAYVQLFTGFLDKLIYYAKNHKVRVTHLLATAWTAEGKRMCQFFSMKEVGRDKFGDTIFELDLAALQSASIRGFSPAVKRLIKVYRDLPV